MREFVVQAVKLQLDEKFLTPKLLNAFERSTYEKAEATQLARIVKDGDRILELGGGVGFLSSLASKLVKVAHCTVVEANPDLIPVIKETHRINSVTANVMMGVAASRRSKLDLPISEKGEVPFYQRDSFWGSSLDGSWRYESVVNVPVLDLQAIMDTADPTVLLVDIEGGELNIFDRIDLSNVRHVVIEVHKSVIGLEGVDRVVKVFSQEGLYLDPDGTNGAVFMFSRPRSSDASVRKSNKV